MKSVAPKRVLSATIAFVIVTTVLVGIGVWRLREDAVASALRETDNITTILAEQAGHSARAIDIILDEVLAGLRPGAAESEADYVKRMKGVGTYDFLKDRLAQLPQADVVAVTDKTGQLLNLTREWPSPAVDLSDRDYFQYLSTTHDPQLFISRSYIGRVSGVWTIFFAKRVETANGDLASIIYVGVRPDFFIRALDVIRSVGDRSLTLLRQDGSVLLHYPDSINPFGTKMPQGAHWYQVATSGGDYLAKMSSTGQMRWIATRPVPHYPLVVNVDIGQDQTLESWRIRATIIAGCSLAMELLFVVLMMSLHKQFSKVRASEHQLAIKSRHVELVNQRFEAALSNTTHGIAMFDSNGRLLIKNGKYERILGLHNLEFQFTPSITGGSADSDLASFATVDGLTITAYARGGQSDVLSLEDGRSIRIMTETMPQGGWVTTLEDVTERQRANDKIIRLAHFDGLTMIANRTRFMAELGQSLASDVMGGCGIMLLDLDHFKEVNDTYGHGIGDALLQTVAQRLVGALKTDDLVARLGGDEFAILCCLADRGLGDLDRLAQRLLADVTAPFQIQGNDIAIGLSIGVALGEGGPNAVEQVMRHADLALYQAKADGRNCCRFFEPSMEERYNQRKQLTLDLEQAIKRDELTVHYQPIVDAGSLRILSMEALVRWNHPKRGMISPIDFIPLAEECGLIYGLGEWVLRRACLDAMAWPADVRVAVNVSTMQLIKGSFSDVAAAILAETGLPARRLKLEITESVLLGETAKGLANLNALRQLGVAIILDDFGTGYSSLSYLKRFHFDEIKIDKSFVDDLGRHGGSTAIVAATITLARELGIATTAEGVESGDQRVILQAAGVQQLQGYLFGRPGPADSWRFDKPMIAQARAS